MKAKNYFSGKIEQLPVFNAKQRAAIYHNAAYCRIFKQGIQSCCKAIEYEAGINQFIPPFCSFLPPAGPKRKKIMEALFPEFALFSTGNWGSYWFNGEHAKDERITMLLFCAEMATQESENSIKT